MDTLENIQAQITAQRTIQQETEKSRHDHECNMEARRAKLELIRLAKETLIENARHQTTDYAPVTAAGIIAFAEELTQSVNA